MPGSVNYRLRAYWLRLGSISLTLRFRHPITQRWPNRDPLGETGGINLYGFVGNHPTGRLDPEGNSPAAIAIGACAGAGTAVTAPAAVVVTAGVATLVGGFEYGSWVGLEIGLHDWLGNLIGDAIGDSDGRTPMAKPRRNSGRLGHRGVNDAQTHEDAQGHGGSRPPNFTPKPKRSPSGPKEVPPSPPKSKFPIPDRCK